jgi:hypothetical protein
VVQVAATPLPPTGALSGGLTGGGPSRRPALSLLLRKEGDLRPCMILDARGGTTSYERQRLYCDGIVGIASPSLPKLYMSEVAGT